MSADDRVAMGSAAIWRGPVEGIDVSGFALPAELEPGAALVKVRLSTICGSDIHTIRGERSSPVPTVLGHEIVGDVVATGGSIYALDGSPVSPGQRVTWTVNTACGACRRCRRGMSNKCARVAKYGHEAVTPQWTFNGGFASHCHLLPGTAITVVPEGLSDRLVAPANCATATVMGALRCSNVRTDDVLVVQGCGMLGLTAIACARHMGVAAVVACDADAYRRALAEQLGAAVIAAPDELSAAAETVTSEGVDIVLEMSGQPSAVEASIGLLGIGGRLVLVGSVSPGPDVPVSPETIVRRLLTVVGCHNYLPEDLLAAVRFLDDTLDRDAIEGLVPVTYPLSRLDEAVAAAVDPPAPPRVAVVPD